MSWYRVDDGFPDHRKVEKLEQMGHRMWADALALWLVAGCYCSKVGSGGVISRAKIDRLVTNHRALNRTIAALCDVGLWHEELHDGVTHYRFHDWDDCNPTEYEVAETKRKNAERQRKYRQKRARERNALQDRYETPSSRARVTRPDPTRPDHPPTSGEVAPTREVQPQQPGSERHEGPHPRQAAYGGGLLSPEAVKVHELLLGAKLPLHSPVGVANWIASKLGPLGHNQLTMDRVAMMVESIRETHEGATADGAPRTPEETRRHIETWLRKPAHWWKNLEQRAKAPPSEPQPPELKLYRASKEEAENDPWSPANRAKHRQQQLAALDAMDRKAREKAAAAIAAERQRLDP